MSLSDSEFEPGGKRNFLQLTDKDGEQPQIASVSGDWLTKQALFSKIIRYSCTTVRLVLKLNASSFLLIYLYIDVHRMSREQRIAVDWMTVPRSALLGLYHETAVQAAVVTTVVHLTLTRPSSTNLTRVRFDHQFDFWQPFLYMISADFLLLVSCPHCRLCGLGQPSYDLLLEQSFTNAVHDPWVQKCTLQVRNNTQKCMYKVLLVMHNYSNSSKTLTLI